MTPAPAIEAFHDHEARIHEEVRRNLPQKLLKDPEALTTVLTQVGRYVADRMDAADAAPWPWVEILVRDGLLEHIYMKQIKCWAGKLPSDLAEYAADVAQETAARVSAKWFTCRLEGEGARNAWVFQICWDLRRKLIKNPRNILYAETGAGADADDEGEKTSEIEDPNAIDLISAAAATQQAEFVEHAIATLPAMQQEAIRRRFVLDQSYKQAATDLGVTENAFGLLLHRALTRLRELWKAREQGDESKEGESDRERGEPDDT